MPTSNRDSFLEDIDSCYSDRQLEKTLIVDLERYVTMKILFQWPLEGLDDLTGQPIL